MVARSSLATDVDCLECAVWVSPAISGHVINLENPPKRLYPSGGARVLMIFASF